MNVSRFRLWRWVLVLSSFATSAAWGQGTRDTTTYRRLKTVLDAVPAIDTHDHLWPFDRLPGYFEDFIMWRLVELSARYDLPFQIHTGHGRIQGSNPMNLVDLIEANPRTKFILFHGGFPWVGETGIILMRHGSHVWLDSVWMPTLSYATAKRAFHEWLDVMPSSRIMWGGDANHGEGIYGATEMTRRCLAEVLAERVDSGDLREEHALTIGRQVLRDNALALFPQLKERLWKHKGITMKPPAPTVPSSPAR
jgi:predicted TIM-barrel fold metal-dependent hydrolase